MNVCISYGIDDWNFKSNWTADYFDIRCKKIYIYIYTSGYDIASQMKPDI